MSGIETRSVILKPTGQFMNNGEAPKALHRVTVREFGYLVAEGDAKAQGLDYVCVPMPAWYWLKNWMLSEINRDSRLLTLRSRGGQEALQVQNLVGVLQTPCGTQIEILPKDTGDHADVASIRKRFLKMLRVARAIPYTPAHDAHLSTEKVPLLEVLISYFLAAVSDVVRRGIRSDYHRIHSTERFLKGQLQVAQQLRKGPGHQHQFSIQYDAYLPDRPENRLLHLALKRVLNWTRTAENQRKARELLFAFADVPVSTKITQDFSRWSSDRGMAYYQICRPWVELIVAGRSPYAMSGSWKGISLLFPMEKLFESYVERVLERQLSSGYLLTGQACSEYLVTHNNSPMFQLRPDIAIHDNQRKAVAILDTKWKLIDGRKSGSQEKYDLSQSDFYQLFAYGEKYLEGNGNLYLIYPAHAQFREALPAFNFSDTLRVWVVPFDLDDDCLVAGLWVEDAMWHRKQIAHAA